MERDIKPTYDELESYVENLQKQLADAQATIAALRQELKVTGNYAGGEAEQIAALQARVRTATQFIIAEIGASGPEDLEEAVGRIVGQLQQRTAELEAATQHHEQSENAAQLYYRELTRAKNRICEAAGLPPDSGYEPAIKHLQAGLKRVREELADERTAYKALSEQYNRLDLEHDDLRTLLLALPKVEGEITCSRQIDSAWGLHYWQVEAYGVDDECIYCLSNLREEEAKAYATLLQHRQGMEG